MKYWLVLVIYMYVYQLQSVTSQMSMVPCNTNPYNNGPPLPKLPDQFRMNIEANIVQKNLTRNFVEYYDYPGNRGRVDWYNGTGGDRMYTIMDFGTKQSWMVFNNGTCEILKTNSSLARLSFMVGKDGSHIKTVKQLLYLGDDLGEVYIGPSKVRGIVTNQWRTCVKIPATNGTFTLDYYFSKGSGYFIDGKEIELPVRAVINGTGKSMRSPNSTAHSFYHIYDFYDVKPGPIKNQEIFQVPPGIVCNHGDKSDVYPTPKLSEQFSTTIEQTTTTPDGRKRTVCNVVHVDNESNIFRLDTTQSIPRGRPTTYGHNPLSFIHDINNGLLYTIDRYMKNCSVEKVVTSSPIDLSFTSINDLAVNLSEFRYQGQKTLRGMHVYSWGFYNSTSHTYVDIMFQSPKTTRPGPGQNTLQPQQINLNDPILISALKPVGMFQYIPGNANQNATYIEEHVIDFTSGHLDNDVFDVSKCYVLNSHSMMLAVDVTGQYITDIVKYYTQVLISKVRHVIANAAKVSPTRVSSIQFELRSAPDMNVDPFLMMTFELLDNKLTGLDDVTVAGPSLQEALTNLQVAWKTGNTNLQFQIKPNSGRSMTLSIRDGSLWQIQPQYMTVTDSSATPTYGPGAMVGLALGMLVIGAILGLLASYVIYKKIDTSVPYQVTN